MAQVIVAPEAEEDLLQISRYIGRDNPVRAASFVGDITGTISGLAHQPHMGRDRSDIMPGLRSFPHRDYLIFYRVAETDIVILRVLHGARDIHAIFGS